MDALRACRRASSRGLLAAVLALAASTAGAAPHPRAALAGPHLVLAAGTERHADPTLEALLPTTLGGVALKVESQAGTDLSTRSGPFDAFLAGLGKTRADFSLASAYSQGGDLKAEIGAWRVTGADPAALLPGFRAVLQASSTTPLTVAEETLGGRSVTRIGDPGQLTRGPLYVIVRGETLLFVQTPEPALAEEAMQKLPR
jgi:hypothetical protein